MAGKTFRFTKSAIDQLSIPTVAEAGSAGYVMYWDTTVTGFGVVVRPSGLMTFILVYRSKEGRVRRLTIGRYGRVTLDQARAAAKQHNGRVVLGGDPVADKKRDRSAMTVDEVFQAYLDRHIKNAASEHAERSVKRVRGLIKKSLGNKFIHQLEAGDINECLEQYEHKRGNFNLILTYLRAIWNWARNHRVGLTKETPKNSAAWAGIG